jgi:hypothetical protein
LPSDRAVARGFEEKAELMYQSAEGHGQPGAHSSERAEPLRADDLRSEEPPEVIAPDDEELRAAEFPGDRTLSEHLAADDDTPSEGFAFADEVLAEASAPEIPEPEESEAPVIAGGGEWTWSTAAEAPSQPVAAVREPPPSVNAAIAAARAEFAAAELRASAVLSQGYIEAEAIRVRGKQEARLIIQRAEERAAQVLERTNAEATAAERRARLSAEAMLAEAQVRLDQFLADRVGEVEEEPGPVDVAADTPPEEPAEPVSEYEPIPAFEAPLEPELAEPATVPVYVEPPEISEPSEVSAISEPTSSTYAVASDQILLTPLPSDGDRVRFRVTGPLTFARIMALEQALQSLDGVSSAVVTPEGGEAATISFVAQDAARAVDDLLRVPGLPLGMAP